MYSFIFRVDSGNIPELGTGHLYRCINIYNYLIKKGINKRKLLFITKTTGKYEITKKILNRHNIRYETLSAKILDYSKEEIFFLQNFNSRVIILDRLSRINSNFVKLIKKNFKKVIGIDILKKKEIKIDYFINPLNNDLNNKHKLKNFKNNILPSLNKRKQISKKNKIKKIFVFFGGYDYKKINDKIKKIVIKNSKFVIPKSKSNFFDLMSQSDLVICSGGLTVFDAIYFNKIIISVPQYRHQLKNLKILQENGAISLCKISSKFKKNMKNLIQHSLDLSYKEKSTIYKKQNKIISSESQLKTLNKIYDANL